MRGWAQQESNWDPVIKGHLTWQPSYAVGPTQLDAVANELQ
jgi:hypothetical protein